MKKRINGCRKGKRGEREAAKFLCSLGFKAERSARNGVKGCHDLIVHDLPRVVVEVKYGVQGLDLGTKAIEEVIQQAIADCNAQTFITRGLTYRDRVPDWCVLWQPSRKCWRLTYYDKTCGIVTQTGEVNIKSALKRLNH